MSASKDNKKRAVIILSGGLDSTTCMGIAKEEGYELYPISFDYGQRHKIEIENAKQVAEHYGVSARHKIIKLDFLRDFGGSALTDDNIDVPNVVDGLTEGSEESEIPVTYVPGRNLLFLSIATSFAEVTGSEAIYIGVNALDYSGYPDCRPEFIHKVEEVIALATKVGVEGKGITIETPLIDWTKARIVQEGLKIGVPYELTTSCYNGKAEACGVCDSCRLRLKGFEEAGSKDPIPYLA
ncbi:7-cyano-7-deazaguanine synthase QueC [Paenibacillus alginolyticus]|uniref:7-cyano-7-deazaguanine synthase n=1 Tax=Paenibacillus alginolyticus TaxID=59839 RepID=A0ABT4GF46_9BACL|nr:7-cyano-7-deazaguanine synthase QueC [Paenibacillus alginolyticus]MCY9694719.1 7-cyano-7-deazaguanine synthase QueC [Paenibacillus alginolyticus]MEC0147110.1 7-cyano-7-deazaguanine synthase QueC [Paenibacillus alginolyticus]